jgi:hypothetical protein
MSAFDPKRTSMMSALGAPSRNRRRAATPAIGPLGAVAEAGFAIALAAMLSERPVHGTSIQSGAQHDGRTDTMRIAVIGAGGVGGSFGAALANAGNDVTFVARGAHLAAMRARGLSVLGPRGDIHLNPVQATDDPASIGPVDYVMFCVKLWDVESAGAAVLRW